MLCVGNCNKERRILCGGYSVNTSPGPKLCWGSLTDTQMVDAKEHVAVAAVIVSVAGDKFALIL